MFGCRKETFGSRYFLTKYLGLYLIFLSDDLKPYNLNKELKTTVYIRQTKGQNSLKSPERAISNNTGHRPVRGTNINLVLKERRHELRF